MRTTGSTLLVQYYIYITANIGTNPGLAALWDDERQRQRERGEDSQITPPDSPGGISRITFLSFIHVGEVRVYRFILCPAVYFH